MTEDKVLDKLLNWIGNKLSKPISYDENNISVTRTDLIEGGYYIPQSNGLMTVVFNPKASGSYESCYLFIEKNNIREYLASFRDNTGGLEIKTVPMLKGAKYTLKSLSGGSSITVIEFPFDRVGGVTDVTIIVLPDKKGVILC